MMADVSTLGSSYENVNNCSSSWDSSTIIESVKSKSIAYDGTRVKWCKDYELLKVFIESAFCMHGKWWSFGGSSKKFEASNADFSIIWYPGKLNTVTFSGKMGEQAKKHIIKYCMSSNLENVDNTVNRKVICYCDSDDGRENLSLEIEVLKSQVDSLQSLLSSIINSSNRVGDLTNKITLLEIDLEEEKLRNRRLEFDVKCLRDEVMLINSHRDGLVNSNETIDLDKSHRINENMTNNDPGNIKDEIMLINQHRDGLINSNEIINLDKTHRKNEEKTTNHSGNIQDEIVIINPHLDGVVRSIEKIDLDESQGINEHMQNNQSCNAQVYLNKEIDSEKSKYIPNIHYSNKQRKCTNEQSAAAERINDQIKEFRHKQSRVFANISRRMPYQEHTTSYISFASQLNEYVNNHRAKQHQFRQNSSFENCQNRSLKRKDAKRNQKSFFAKQHYTIGTIRGNNI